MKLKPKLNQRKTTFACGIILGTVLMFLAVGCKTAKVTGEQEFAPPVASGKPAVIYVADFELGVIKHEEGILSGRSGPIGRVSERLYGGSTDPATRAREIVELMSTSLIKSLNKSGLSAFRLAPGSVMPQNGYLIRGVFTEVQEGNRLQRAMIGMGKGQTDIQVVASIHDLSHGPPQPLYQLETDASSGSKPGAAPTLVLGPYGAAARFVMAGNDLNKNIKQTASQIAERVARRFQEGR